MLSHLLSTFELRVPWRTSLSFAYIVLERTMYSCIHVCSWYILSYTTGQIVTIALLQGHTRDLSQSCHPKFYRCQECKLGSSMCKLYVLPLSYELCIMRLYNVFIHTDPQTIWRAEESSGFF